MAIVDAACLFGHGEVMQEVNAAADTGLQCLILLYRGYIGPWTLII